ncbi:vacuolar sorting protein VPS33/slp1, partial [Blyttiomyces sp. JEL0837]
MALIEDFNKPKPMYASAHVFFTSALSDHLFDKIKKAPGLTPYIKTLRELFIDFLAVESQVFSTDLPSSIFSVYNPPNPASTANEIDMMAKKLVSVMSTIGEFPYIRYYDPLNEKKNASFRLAESLQRELDELQKVDEDFPPKTSFKKATLVIVERSFDMMAPLLHEFTYQAMMNDLLVLEGGKYLYHSESADDKSTAGPTKASLDETDPIFMLIRHWHFAEAVEYIRDNFNRFLSENKAAMTALGQDTTVGGMESLAHMKDTLTSLPQFQEMKAKECKLIFERRKLDSVAAVEQDLATGETADGKVPRNIMIDMVPLLDDSSIPAYDKLRLLMLYVIAQEGIQDSDRKRLLEAAKLSLEDSQALTNLNYMGVKLSAADKKKKANQGKYSYYGRTMERRKKKKKKGAEDELPYDLSRYVPLAKYVIEEQENLTLEQESFPWIQNPPLEEMTSLSHTKQNSAGANMLSAKATSGAKPLFQPLPNAANAYSLRTTRPSWSRPGMKVESSSGGGGGSGGGTGAGGGGGSGGAGGSGAAPVDAEDLRKYGPRVIYFVIGGLTFSEIRATYELMRETKREVFIGSTSITNPTQFLTILKELHRTEPHTHTIANSSSIATSLTNLAGISSQNTSPMGSQNLGGSGEKMDK